MIYFYTSCITITIIQYSLTLYGIVIYPMSVYYRNLTCFNRWQLYFSSKFNVSQCDKSLSAGFNPIKTWQQRAAMPLQPAQGHRLQVKIYRRKCFMEKWPNYFKNTLLYHIGHAAIENALNNQWTPPWTIDERGSQITRKTLFSIAICRQSGYKRQSKTLFLTFLDLNSSIVLMFSIAAYL